MVSLDFSNCVLSLLAKIINHRPPMARPDAVFKALADPTRREILHLLRSGPRSSGDIAEHFPSAWATVSRHLAVLRDAELVSTERNGSSIMYELNTTVFQGTVEGLLNRITPRGTE
jgi:DNA-binding transcriptional ArsR family regulator